MVHSALSNAAEGFAASLTSKLVGLCSVCDIKLKYEISGRMSGPFQISQLALCASTLDLSEGDDPVREASSTTLNSKGDMQETGTMEIPPVTRRATKAPKAIISAIAKNM